MLGKRGHHVHAAASTLGEAVLEGSVDALRTAIVHRACVDYLGALRGLKRMNGSAIGTKEHLEKFFRSTGFMLCVLSARLIEGGFITSVISGAAFRTLLFGQSLFDGKGDLAVFFINGKNLYFYNIVHFDMVIDVLYEAVGYL